MLRKKPLLVATIALLVAGGLLLGGWLKIMSHPDTLPVLDIQTTENKVPLHSLLQPGKPMLLNFWSVSCAPCLREIPSLKQLHHDHGDKVVIVAVAMSYDPPDAVLDMARDLPYQVALDLDGVMAQQLGTYVTPTYLLVQPDGSITGKYIGQVDFGALTMELARLDSG